MAAERFAGPGGPRQALHGHMKCLQATYALAPFLTSPALLDTIPIAAGEPPGTGTGTLCRWPPSLLSAGNSKVLASLEGLLLGLLGF